MRAKYCINCGKLLYNRSRCISCGTEAAEYTFDAPGMRTELSDEQPTAAVPVKRVRCKACGKIILNTDASCQYCGADQTGTQGS